MKTLKNLSLVIIAILFATYAQARDQIKIVGSSTVYPYATVVAEKFGKSGSFKTPVIESTGTGGGMKLFCAGVGENHPDITNASRQIKSSEVELCKKNGVNDIVEITVGNDGITFAQSVKAKDINFTKEQLWRALAKEVEIDGKMVANPYKKWSDIASNLPDTKIEILIAPPTSGTRDAWNALVMEKGCTKKAIELLGNKEKCAEIREDGAAIEAGENDTLIVQKLAANPDAFGFFGFSYLVSNKDKIKAASIEGVQPTLKGIQDYSYPIARPLFFYVKKAHVGVIPGIQEFLNEFTSSKAMGRNGYLTQVGLVPLGDSEMKVVKSNAKNLSTIK